MICFALICFLRYYDLFLFIKQGDNHLFVKNQKK